MSLLTEDRSSQPKARVIGKFDGLGISTHAHHAGHRSKRLLAHNLHLMIHPTENGNRAEIAFTFTATEEDFRAIANCRFNLVQTCAF